MALAATLAVVGGFGLGYGLFRLPRLRRALDPLLASYYAVPTFIFYPLFIVLFGLNRLPLVAIGFVFAVVAMAINTLTGFERVPTVLRRTARALRLSEPATLVQVTMPACAPYLLTGAKLVIAYSFIGVIAGEFVLSGAGIGHEIAFAYNNFDNPTMYGLMLLLIGFVSALNMLLFAWERQILSAPGADLMMVTLDKPARVHWRLPRSVGIDRLLLLLAVLFIWQVLTWIAGPEVITSPPATARKLAAIINAPDFVGHAYETGRAFAAALIISLLGGLVVGLALGSQRLAGEVAEPLLVALYSIPKITLYPVILLLFGFGVSAKIAFGAIMGSFPLVAVRDERRAQYPQRASALRLAMRLTPFTDRNSRLSAG